MEEDNIVDTIINIYNLNHQDNIVKKHYFLYETQFCGGIPRLDSEGYMLIMELDQENTIRIEVIYADRFNLTIQNLIYKEAYSRRYRFNDFIYNTLTSDDLWVNIGKDDNNNDINITPTEGMWGVFEHWHYQRYL